MEAAAVEVDKLRQELSKLKEVQQTKNTQAGIEGDQMRKLTDDSATERERNEVTKMKGELDREKCEKMKVTATLEEEKADKAKVKMELEAEKADKAKVQMELEAASAEVDTLRTQLDKLKESRETAKEDKMKDHLEKQLENSRNKNIIDTFVAMKKENDSLRAMQKKIDSFEVNPPAK